MTKRKFGETAFLPKGNRRSKPLAVTASAEKETSSEMKSRSLFHYTTADGLIGILESGNLRATHYDFLNDTTECQVIMSLLLPKLEKELRTVVPKLVELRVFDKQILNNTEEVLYKKQAEGMLRAMTTTTNKVAPFFITSFCMHAPEEPAYKNGLLSQWRGYARGGFAIEFDELVIDDLAKKENAKFRYQGILTNQVAYRDHEDHLEGELFSGIAGAFLKHLFPKIADQLAEVLGSKTSADFARPFLSKAPFLKNTSFEEENEYRIVALCNRPTKAEEGDNRLVKQIMFRPKPNGDIVPFIELFGEIETPLPIKSILIGPHHSQDNRRTAVEILLEKRNLTVPIRISDIPFRE